MAGMARVGIPMKREKEREERGKREARGGWENEGL
jgi:hypothetical protein